MYLGDKFIVSCEIVQFLLCALASHKIGGLIHF